MKRIATFILILMTCIAAVSAANGPIRKNQLPKNAQTFINDYWPNVQMLDANRDKDQYEVTLEGGTTIVFNRKGLWISIDNAYGFPNHFLPDSIGDFIRSKYPSSYITHVSRHHEGYTVILNSGLELHYDRTGHIQRVDD